MLRPNRLHPRRGHARKRFVDLVPINILDGQSGFFEHPTSCFDRTGKHHDRVFGDHASGDDARAGDDVGVDGAEFGETGGADDQDGGGTVADLGRETGWKGRKCEFGVLHEGERGELPVMIPPGARVGSFARPSMEVSGRMPSSCS